MSTTTTKFKHSNHITLILLVISIILAFCEGEKLSLVKAVIRLDEIANKQNNEPDFDSAYMDLLRENGYDEDGKIENEGSSEDTGIYDVGKFWKIGF